MSLAARSIVLLVSLVVALSAGYGIYMAVEGQKAIWFLLAFESIVLLAAFVGVLAGLNRFTTGPALALLCVAGTIFGASVLGYLAASGTISQIDMRIWLGARALAAGVLLLVAGGTVLARRPALSRKPLVRGIVLVEVLVVSAVALYLAKGWLAALPSTWRTIAILGAGTWFLALFAPAVHFFIRAFEQGRLPDEIDRPMDVTLRKENAAPESAARVDAPSTAA